MSGWTRPADIRRQLEKRWKRGDGLRAALDALTPPESEHAHTINLPYRLSLRGPSQREMVEQFDELRKWIDQIRRGVQKDGIEIEWKSVNHRQLGRNELPAAVVVPDLERFAKVAGGQRELTRFRELAHELTSRLPETVEWVRRRPFELLEHEAELDRLIRFSEWMRAHPPEGMYLRQVDLPAIDTKFLEAHTGILSAWLDLVLPGDRVDSSFSPGRAFAQRYGFSRKPDLVRFRLLDGALASRFGGFSDLSVPADEFSECRFDRRGVRYVFVVENDISALALPAADESIVLFGRGYYFQFLAEAEWPAHTEVYYWGDIDTHGFAILNEFRRFVPHAKSFLMDRETLVSHRDHWSEEPSQFSGSLGRLSDTEGQLYAELVDGQHGTRVRLEQERVRFGRVREVIHSIIRKQTTSGTERT